MRGVGGHDAQGVREEEDQGNVQKQHSAGQLRVLRNSQKEKERGVLKGNEVSRKVRKVNFEFLQMQRLRTEKKISMLKYSAMPTQNRRKSTEQGNTGRKELQTQSEQEEFL